MDLYVTCLCFMPSCALINIGSAYLEDIIWSKKWLRMSYWKVGNNYGSDKKLFY